MQKNQDKICVIAFGVWVGALGLLPIAKEAAHSCQHAVCSSAAFAPTLAIRARSAEKTKTPTHCVPPKQFKPRIDTNWR